MGHVIRSASLLDIPAMIRIDKAVQASCWTYLYFIRRLFFPYHAWVVKSAGKVLAFAVVELEKSRCAVLNIAVSPCCQRLGCGRALLQEIIAEAQQHGLRHLMLEVAVDNVSAKAFYEYHGFKQAAYLLNYYQVNGLYVDAWRMHYAL